MLSTQAVNEITKHVLETTGINLSLTVCNMPQFNKAVKLYREGTLNLEDASAIALESAQLD